MRLPDRECRVPLHDRHWTQISGLEGAASYFHQASGFSRGAHAPVQLRSQLPERGAAPGTGVHGKSLMDSLIAYEITLRACTAPRTYTKNSLTAPQCKIDCARFPIVTYKS
jgi:hypothetical protein